MKEDKMSRVYEWRLSLVFEGYKVGIRDERHDVDE